MHGPEPPRGIDLPHGRIIVVDGRAMVYSIMHGYHLPLDEAPDDTSAIYHKILGDVALERAAKQDTDAPRKSKREDIIQEVGPDDVYLPCTSCRRCQRVLRVSRASHVATVRDPHRACREQGPAGSAIWRLSTGARSASLLMMPVRWKRS